MRFTDGMRRPVSAGCDTLPRIDVLEAHEKETGYEKDYHRAGRVARRLPKVLKFGCPVLRCRKGGAFVAVIFT
jgi:hypothetical protein